MQWFKFTSSRSVQKIIKDYKCPHEIWFDVFSQWNSFYSPWQNNLPTSVREVYNTDIRINQNTYDWFGKSNWCANNKISLGPVHNKLSWNEHPATTTFLRTKIIHTMLKISVRGSQWTNVWKKDQGLLNQSQVIKTYFYHIYSSFQMFQFVVSSICPPLFLNFKTSSSW